MYASEAELKAIEERLLDVNVIPFNLEAQIEGTFSFENSAMPLFVEEQVARAGFAVVERVTLKGRKCEYTIALAVPATAADAGEADAGDHDLIAYLESIEKRYDELRDLIKKHYCEAFGLAWVNVSLGDALMLLAKYAKPTWESELAAQQHGATAGDGSEG